MHEHSNTHHSAFINPLTVNRLGLTSWAAPALGLTLHWLLTQNFWITTQLQGSCILLLLGNEVILGNTLNNYTSVTIFAGNKSHYLPYYDLKMISFQLNWEKRILKSLNSMCTELNTPLAKKVWSRVDIKKCCCISCKMKYSLVTNQTAGVN
jgi:hypothetical protein